MLLLVLRIHIQTLVYLPSLPFLVASGVHVVSLFFCQYIAIFSIVNMLSEKTNFTIDPFMAHIGLALILILVLFFPCMKSNFLIEK